MTRLRAPGRRPVRVPSIRSNAGVAAWYASRLVAAVDAMCAEAERAILAAYPKDIPQEMAQDALPGFATREAIKRLQAKWKESFGRLSSEAAGAFAGKSAAHSDLAFREALKRAGFSVDFQMTDAMRGQLKDIVRENVDLIKSIPSEHFAAVRREVLDSVTKGRNLKGLAEVLHERHGVTRRRAGLISRDQNDKATALLNRVRQKELDLNRARWIHTASAHPREEHLDWDGEIYDVDVGMYSEEDGEYVWPGTAINCGCLSETIVPGYDEEEGPATAGAEAEEQEEQEVQ